MNYIAGDFHLHYLSTYTLYVQSDFQSDHLVVLDGDKQVLVYMVYDNLSPSAEAMKILSMPFQKVFIGLPHESLVWVPAEMYDDAEKGLYANYFVDGSIDRIIAKEMLGLGIVALYQYDQLLYSRWMNLFPEANFIPNFEVVIRQAQSNIPIQGEVLGVHVYDDQADIFLFINGELKLYNTFEIATPDDLSYFVLNIYKNFSIKEKVPKVLLSGTRKDSEWYLRMERYGEQIAMIRPKERWNIDVPAIEEQLQELNVLVDSVLCV